MMAGINKKNFRTDKVKKKIKRKTDSRNRLTGNPELTELDLTNKQTKSVLK